jgi:hypoxanthine phosphoribosyltransferase
LSPARRSLILIVNWPLYRGHRITNEDVRNWIGQRKSFREQRLLFKLLQNVRFVSEEEVREKVRIAHSIVKKHTTPFTPETRSQRRFDVIVTYVDGPGKSGSRYADRYAEENLISTTCVADPKYFSEKVIEHEEKRGVVINGVVIIDDIVATGNSLAENIETFVKNNAQFVKDRNISVVAVSLLSTREGDERVRRALHRIKGVDVDFRACEIIENRYYAFGSNNNIWSSAEEAEQAKDMIRGIGLQLSKTAPLGFGDLGLVVVFYDTCLNNTLPILHAGKSSVWSPLFERAKN